MNDEAIFIMKPKIPFYRSPYFLTIVLISILLAISFFVTKKPPFKTSENEQVKQIKPLKSVPGMIEAVDVATNTVTIIYEGKQYSYQVANNLLISEITHNVDIAEGQQVSLPLKILDLSEIKNKKGELIYLIFNVTGDKVDQIQIYNK